MMSNARREPTRRRLLWLSLALLLVAAAGCSDDQPGAAADVADDADAAGDGSGDAPIDGTADAEGDGAADLEGDGADGDSGPDTGEDVADVSDTATDRADMSDDDAPLDTDAATDPDDGADGPDDDLSDAAPDAPLADLDLGDVTPPLEGFGTIAGECGVLDDTEWTDTEGTYLYLNTLDFADDPYDEADLELLTSGAQRVIEEGNLNPGSLLSEAFAFEMLRRCELARLLRTEGAVDYANPDGAKTDLLTRIDDRSIAVSVTRAHPLDNPFDATRARELMIDKLEGIEASDANQGEDTWERQMLHIMAADAGRVTAIETAYAAMLENVDDAALLESVIIIVTRTDGADDPIYCMPSPCPE